MEQNNQGAASVQPLPPQQQKKKSSCSATTVILIILIGVILYAMNVPCFLYARNKSVYSACLESLSTVSKGIQSYLTENDTMDDLDQYGDAICNHVLPGYDKPDGCKGMVKKRIDESCAADTFIIKYPGSFTYEVTGTASDKMNCHICVTEVGYAPKSYAECKNNTPVCQH